MKKIGLKMRLVVTVAVLAAISAGYVSFSRPTERFGAEIAVELNSPEEDPFEASPSRAVVATENIYPKLTSPGKRLFPGYPDFEEVPGTLSGEVVLLAPCGAEIGSLYDGVVGETDASGRWNGGYGNFVRIEVPGDDKVYDHLDKVFVKEGEVVKKGDSLGTAGRTGSLPEGQPCLFGIMD